MFSLDTHRGQGRDAAASARAPPSEAPSASPVSILLGGVSLRGGITHILCSDPPTRRESRGRDLSQTWGPTQSHRRQEEVRVSRV